MIRNTIFFLVLVSSTILFGGCTVDKKSREPYENFATQFYKHPKSLEILVGYEEGAKPYNTYNQENSWLVTHKSLKSLLGYRNINITVPTSSSELINLGEFEQINYTRQNIIDLSSRLQQYSKHDYSSKITVLFLNGYLIENGQPNNQTLGININGRPTLAIFKPVINFAATSISARTLIEQTTVVHEIGHALGLVNNGVEPLSNHHDKKHGAHCTNKKCVMYWQNSGADILDFIQPFLHEKNMNLFGESCIADVMMK